MRDDLWRPLAGVSRRYVLTLSTLCAIALWGLIAWCYQIYAGIGVAGIRRPVFWGLYLVDFVFFFFTGCRE